MVVKVTLAKLALPLLETCPMKPVDFGWTRSIFNVIPYKCEDEDYLREMVRAATWPTEGLAGTLFPLVYYCLGLNRFYTVFILYPNPLASQLIKENAYCLCSQN